MILPTVRASSFINVCITRLGGMCQSDSDIFAKRTSAERTKAHSFARYIVLASCLLGVLTPKAPTLMLVVICLPNRDRMAHSFCERVLQFIYKDELQALLSAP